MVMFDVSNETLHAMLKRKNHIVNELYYALERLEVAHLQKIPSIEEEQEYVDALKAARVLLDKYEDEA